MENRNIEDHIGPEGKSAIDTTTLVKNKSPTPRNVSQSSLGSIAKKTTGKGIVGVIIFSCIVIVIIFFVVFGLLQARTNKRMCWSYRYQPVPTYYDTHSEKILLTKEDFEDEDEIDTCNEDSSPQHKRPLLNGTRKTNGSLLSAATANFEDEDELFSVPQKSNRTR